MRFSASRRNRRQVLLLASGLPFSVVIFLGNVILGHFCSFNLTDIHVPGSLHAANHTGFEGLPLFQQLFHAFGIGIRNIG